VTVLILGGGVMQVPAIRIARAKGWRVVIADGNPNAVARGMCDSFETVDLKDLDGMTALAHRLSREGGLDGIFTAGTDFSTTVAHVAEKMGLPGIGWDTALRATDKVLMRQAFERAGVPSPRFSCWTGNGDPVAILGSIRPPVVVKPADNMGARGVRRVDDQGDLASACEAALALSRSRRVIVEQYMDGPELSLDAVVYRGEISVCGVADRHIFFPPYFVEMGHTMPTDLGGAEVKEVKDLFCSGIRALGIREGAAKGDIKLTPDGAKVGEIAARLSGGFMSGWTYPLSSGIEVTDAALNIAVGLPPGNLEPLWSKTSAERAFISIPGRVREVLGAEDARRISGIRDVFLRVSPEQEVVFPKNNMEKCGNVISLAESRVEAIRAATHATSTILIRLHPFHPLTDEFLFHRVEDGGVACAYPIWNRAPRAETAGMKEYRGDPSGLRADAPIPVLSPRSIGEERAVDWNGLDLWAALSRLIQSGRITLVDGPGSGGFLLGGLFWRSLWRGGMQGALYLLDCLTEASRKGTTMRYLSSICAR
jgi:biotin carboxylase